MKKSIIIYSLVILLAATDAMEEGMTACLELLNVEGMEKGCCDIFSNPTLSVSEMEMFSNQSMATGNDEDALCKRTKDLFEKQGFMNGDEINEDKINKLLSQQKLELPQLTTIADRIRDECLDGHYKVYPPEGNCSTLKMGVCIFLNSLAACDSWKDDAVCQQMGINAKTCKDFLDEDSD